ncbi:hypothetical protein CTAYLR_001814 [Chrysophaeum taylorii]|uniref:Uncharacterized protein n=1 Tax=Chrysophaeum taylorii TaxID=2483200 RepID=A0AAD7XJ43_9STRA|nr:hypothetical protein CTAYLR_001814 [Chrysophaeum taylorii]
MWQLRAGGLLGATSVATGAAGAHALGDRDPAYVAIWKTAVQYHQCHALALLATPMAAAPRARLVAGLCFASGTCLFSGSCYAVAWTEDRTYGRPAPVGGLLLIGGWLALALL